MKTRKIIYSVYVSLIAIVLFVNTASAQEKKDSIVMKDCCIKKDCCMMKDGKMMVMKAGMITPMEKDMTMKNGTVCMTTGECKMKNGKSVMMKEGDCIDMKGTLENCEKMNTKPKGKTKKEKEEASTYTCSMHPEVTSDKPGKCPKCGMELIKKK